MVPENIRQVERPLNTVVENTGRPGFKQYPVRERKGGVRVNGKYQPHNGIVIGYIYEGRFIPKETKLTTNADMKAYGQAALVHSVVDDIELDLTSVFDIKQAYQIISIACLRVINAGISCRYLKSEYDASFISEYYPNLGLSSSTLTELLKSLGKDLKKRQEFYLRRLTAVCEKHRIAIDGSLFQDTSNINDLSGYSHKARVKGCADISLLFAFDIDLREPLCAQVFPGCEIDASAYEAFITNNKIEKGILVTDKGFPPSKIKKLLEKHSTLHYLTPIKCNDKRILEYDMLSFQGVLLNIDKNVRYKKCQVSENLFLYSFQDGSRATGQFMKALEQAKKEGSFERFSMGDSVMLLPDRKNAIVYQPADDEGNVIIQIRDRKMTVRHNRLKLLVPAEQLYPPDYDFSIVFDTVANRKAAHTMDRKYDPDAVIIVKEGKKED